MASIEWKVTSGSGDWSTAGAWSTATVPNSGDAVFIDLPGAYTVNVTTVQSAGSLNLTDTAATLAIHGGGALALFGAIVNSSTINIVGDNNADADLTARSSVTLSGGGTVRLQDVNHAVLTGSAGATLDNVNNTIVGIGKIGNGASVKVINEAGGTINADGVAGPLGLTIDTGSAALVNQGLIEVTNAGLLTIKSAIANSGGTIAAVNGALHMSGVVISGGTLSGSAFIAVGGGSKNSFDGSASALTNLATIWVDTGAELDLLGTIANSATLRVVGDNSLDSPLVAAGGSVTLTGGGTVRLSDATHSIITTSAGATLDNVNNTIVGIGRIGNGASIALTNEANGKIDADGVVGSLGLTINTGSIALVNKGLIEVTNAGLLTINSAIANSGGVISSVNGSLIFAGATISGGMISGGADVEVVSKSTFDGSVSPLTNSSTVLVRGGGQLDLLGTIVNSGTLRVVGDNSLDSPLVAAGGTVTLTGGGTVLLSDPGHSVITTSSAVTLDNINNTIVGAGRIGTGAAANVINEAGGTINANDGRGLVINTGSAALVNQGLIEVTNGGVLTVSGTVAESGGNISVVNGTLTIASGGAIQGFGSIAGSLTGPGTVVATGGTLELQSAIASSAGPTFEIANDAANVLQVDGTVGTGNTFAFLGRAGKLGLGNDSGFNSTISGLNASNARTNFVDVEGHTVTISSVVSDPVFGSGTVTLSDGAVLHLTNIDTYYWSVNAASDGAGGTAIYLTGKAPTPAPADFDADHTSDVLWRNNATGDTGFWAISNNQIAGWHGFGQSPTSYSVVGLGDFNGDGTADVLWRNATNGDTGYWTTANGTIAGWTDLGQAPVAYSVVGVGDFSGDGTADVLWRDNTTGDTGYWRIANNAIAGWTGLGQSPTTFNVVGVGDFNGDGTADVLWRNPTNGDTGYWTMVNNQIGGWVDLGQAPTTYSVVGVGDFNGDGTADVLWRNSTSGDTGFWAISNDTISSWSGLGQAPTTYNVVGVGDFNYDGTSDVLWRNGTTGDTGYWTIAGSRIAGWTDLGQAPLTYTVENGATSAGAEGNAGGGSGAFGFGDVTLPAASAGAAAATPATAFPIVAAGGDPVWHSANSGGALWPINPAGQPAPAPSGLAFAPHV